MAEKVIHEIRFIETDDGFRVEVKGDKERMRKMGFGPGMGFGAGMMGFAPWTRFWRRRHKHHGRHGHRHHKFGHSFGPWAWSWWDDEFDVDEDFEEPPKEA